MEQLKLFLEKAKTDSELAAKLDALGVKNAADDEVIALAAEHGFTFTKEDIVQMKQEEPKHCGSCKLNEEDLEDISGGHDRHNPEICSQYRDVHYYCVGFFASFWCKHYVRTFVRKLEDDDIYLHTCRNGHFDYEGYDNGRRPYG